MFEKLCWGIVILNILLIMRIAFLNYIPSPMSVIVLNIGNIALAMVLSKVELVEAKGND